MQIKPWLSASAFVFLLALLFASTSCITNDELQLKLEKAYAQGKQDGVSEAWDIAQEKGYKEGYQAGLKEGYTKGYNNGIKKGMQQGSKQGHEKGYQIGRQEGHDIGLAKGIKIGHFKGYADGLEVGKQQAHSQKAKIMSLSKFGMWISISLASLAGIFYLIHRRNKMPDFV